MLSRKTRRSLRHQCLLCFKCYPYLKYCDSAQATATKQQGIAMRRKMRSVGISSVLGDCSQGRPQQQSASENAPDNRRVILANTAQRVCGGNKGALSLPSKGRILRAAWNGLAGSDQAVTGLSFLVSLSSWRDLVQDRAAECPRTCARGMRVAHAWLKGVPLRCPQCRVVCSFASNERLQPCARKHNQLAALSTQSGDDECSAHTSLSQQRESNGASRRAALLSTAAFVIPATTSRYRCSMRIAIALPFSEST